MGTFGKPKQAFADESLVWLKEQIDGKFIYCQLAAKDQYGRVVRLYIAVESSCSYNWTGRDSVH